MKLFINRHIVLMLLAFALFISPLTALAQDRGPGNAPTQVPSATSSPASTEEPSPQSAPLDLAAMALDSLDLPPEFLLSFETYYEFDAIMMLMIGESIDRATMEATGLETYYQSSYVTPAGTSSVRSYLEEYTSDDGAIAGFELLENEETFVPDAAFTDEPAPELGDGPSEITSGSFGSTVPATGPNSIDVTFRVGRIVAGVGMETAEGSTIDRELILQLATRLESRVRAVLAGEPIPLIDSTLPARYVQLGPGWFTTNEGYWSIPDLYGPDVGQDILSAFQSGYFRASTFDPEQSGGFPMPRVAIEVAEFDSARTALFLVGDMENIRPVMTTFTPISLPAIPGSSLTRAWEFPNQFFEGATTDSVRIVMLIGTAVVTVDIQGNGSPEQAQEAAIAIATAQAACLQSVACTTTEFPPDLFVVPEVDPSGDPVG